MFKELLAILRKEDLLKQAMEEITEMLSKAELMFRSAMSMVMESKAPDMDIYERDREINSMELEVRHRVLTHLVLINRKEDASAALVLTSAARDIERIGDYSKSIFELLDFCPKEFVVGGEGARLLRDIEIQILDIFILTEEAYKDADVEKAKTVMEKQLQTSIHCDQILEYLALRPGLRTEYAIIYALLSRYLQRVSSHLKNIAANVVNPFPSVEPEPSEKTEDPDRD